MSHLDWLPNRIFALAAFMADVGRRIEAKHSPPPPQYNHLYVDECSLGPRPGNTTECAVFETDPKNDAVWDRMSLAWHPGVLRHEGVSMIYGTSHAQRTIQKYQNPVSCNGARFLVLQHEVSGIGNLLHHLSRALGLAMQKGLILTVAPESWEPRLGAIGQPWYDPEFCPGKISWECWFLPLSHCQLKGHVTLVSQAQLQRHSYGAFKGDNIGFSKHYTPAIFHTMLRQCSRIKENMWYYWWHAQAVAYFVRFNSATRQKLDALRVTRLRSFNAEQNDLQRTSSLPRGTISVHVRHGEKGNEMRLLPLRWYYKYAQRLALGDQNIRVLNRDFAESNHTFAYSPVSYASRNVFVSTEDPSVIDDAHIFAHQHTKEAWQVFYMTDNRTNWPTSVALLQAKGGGMASLESFLNLELALEGDAWVCTLFSNWCMLIDELRMTVGGKASSPFINLNHRSSIRGPYYRWFHPRCYTVL